jgi:hypothetical protein
MRGRDRAFGRGHWRLPPHGSSKNDARSDGMGKRTKWISVSLECQWVVPTSASGCAVSIRATKFSCPLRRGCRLQRRRSHAHTKSQHTTTKLALTAPLPLQTRDIQPFDLAVVSCLASLPEAVRSVDSRSCCLYPTIKLHPELEIHHTLDRKSRIPFNHRSYTNGLTLALHECSGHRATL